MSRIRKLLRHPAWLTYFGNDRKGEMMVMNHALYGHGPVRAILLHGWFGDGHCCQRMLRGFDPERFCFASMDFRGYGAAKSSEGPFDLNTVASDAIALADSLGWNEFAVVGHSMGGKAALLTTTLATKHVTRLCFAALRPFGRLPLRSMPRL